METHDIWKAYNEELYFFLLKRVKDHNVAKDVFQNTFLKIHKNIAALKQKEKVKAWIFQIARNEVNNFYKSESAHLEKPEADQAIFEEEYQFICCFDKLINELPEIYREVIELIYIKGKKQKEVAEELGISLENTKARVLRAKNILKSRFEECCKYERNKKGKLIGESNCSVC
ncbi:MAG: sigma-70 family RNA polymerase sigma factor [Bacteroidota bacterium]